MTVPLAVAVVDSGPSGPSGPSGAFCARLLSEHSAFDARTSWAGWRAIDRAEQEYGVPLRRDRVKLHDRTRLLAAALTATANGSPTG